MAAYPEQGWSLLCNGVVLFDDAGDLILYSQHTFGGQRRIMAAATL